MEESYPFTHAFFASHFFPQPGRIEEVVTVYPDAKIELTPEERQLANEATMPFLQEMYRAEAAFQWAQAAHLRAQREAQTGYIYTLHEVIRNIVAAREKAKTEER